MRWACSARPASGPRTGPIGPPGTRLRYDEAHRPVSAKDLAMSLKPRAWKTITWREGTNAPPGGCFAAPRVRPAHRDHMLSKRRPCEWLFIEWPPGEDEPSPSNWPEHSRAAHVVQGDGKGRVDFDTI